MTQILNWQISLTDSLKFTHFWSISSCHIFGAQFQQRGVVFPPLHTSCGTFYFSCPATSMPKNSKPSQLQTRNPNPCSAQVVVDDILLLTHQVGEYLEADRTIHPIWFKRHSQFLHRHCIVPYTFYTL